MASCGEKALVNWPKHCKKALSPDENPKTIISGPYHNVTPIDEAFPSAPFAIKQDYVNLLSDMALYVACHVPPQFTQNENRPGHKPQCSSTPKTRNLEHRSGSLGVIELLFSLAGTLCLRNGLEETANAPRLCRRGSTGSSPLLCQCS